MTPNASTPHAHRPLTQAEDKIRRAVEARADALLEDLKLHVATPTGGGNTAALDETRDRFRARLEALGATSTLTEGDARPWWLAGPGATDPADTGEPHPTPPPTLVCARTRPGRPRVLVAGHLDTVHDPEGDFRELSVRPDGKTAVGPGCVDMKGGLVIAVAALEALEEVGVDASWSFLLNSDEETGTYFSDRALRETSARHDFGLALEPALAGGELAIERAGSGQFMIECRGRSAHVGRAFTDGVSAVTALAKALLAVAQMPEPERKKVLSIGPLQGGDATNAVPDLARAWGNARFADHAGGEEILAQLRTLESPEFTGDGALPATRLHHSFARPAKPLTPETEALALRARGVAEALGQRLPFAGTGGVCDGNIMQDAGLPTIDTLGVRGGGLHTKDEWIELDSLVERCQLLAILIARLSQA